MEESKSKGVCGFGGFLDVAVGADRSDPRNPADDLPGRHRPPRGAAEIPRCAAGRPAGAYATELVYQRLLVGDPIEATEQAAKFLKEKPLLDRNCKAHELDNLYVVDTSFFVSIGAVNPSLTAIANAIRVGDHLLQRLA